jgi:2-amino-4-hydroxy-6-hydroxymethyldihydropteridine diphosphokinase
VQTEVYIGLGSNLNSPPLQIQRATRALARLPLTRLTKIAPWYKTIAVGPGNQPDYINTVIALNTMLPPHRLLKKLRLIESQQDRKRLVRWGPRTIDLDILIYGKRQINSRRLVVPHPRLAQRNFVLYPLADIAPDLSLPDHTSLQQLLANCCTNGIVRLTSRGVRGITG